jgi:hypothetical protein
MNAVLQQQLPGMPEPVDVSSAIIRLASDPSVDVSKLEKLMELHERMQSRQAEAEFAAALSACQSGMVRIQADASNPQTHSKYASYAALDRALRPIYTGHGIAISYDTKPADKPEMIRVVAYVSRGSFTRTYSVDMPADGKGAKGGDVMTKTHATGAAMSYGMRYLLKMIFNVAVGEDDKDGNEAVSTLSDEQVANIEALLTETGSNRAAFLTYMKVKSLSDIPSANYSAVVKIIEAKRRK